MIFITTSLCEYMCIKIFSVLLISTQALQNLFISRTQIPPQSENSDLFYFPSIYLIVVGSVSDMPAFFVFQQCAFNSFLFTLLTIEVHCCQYLLDIGYQCQEGEIGIDTFILLRQDPRLALNFLCSYIVIENDLKHLAPFSLSSEFWDSGCPLPHQL